MQPPPGEVCHELDTAIGRLRLYATSRGLRAIAFGEPEGVAVSQPAVPATGPATPMHDRLLADACDQLLEYLSGGRRHFTVPLDPRGTAFQLAVWRAVTLIPYGETRSYQEIAVQLERPRASRAVGAANGANPLPFMIPCHRVIGSSGALTGYAGGLALKRHLLGLERGQGALAL